MKNNDLSNYLKIRPILKTGDAIQWGSNSIIGKIIRTVTDSKVNHTAMVIRFPTYNQDRIFIIEALNHGLVLNSLSNRLLSHKGEVYHLPLVPMPKSLRTKIGKTALDNKGKRIKYDYPSLVRNLFGRVEKNNSKVFCSEFWYITIEESIKKYGNKKFLDLLGMSNEILDNKAPTPADLEMLPLTTINNRLI